LQVKTIYFDSQRRAPLHGIWNIKATHTWVLLLNWVEWCDLVGIRDPAVLQLVDNLHYLFSVIYTWAFVTLEDAVKLTVLERDASRFVDEWIQHIAHTKDRNYYHWLAVEAFQQIKSCGSIWKYASDVTESFVFVFKNVISHFTSHGGGKHGKHWTEQGLSRVCVQALLRALGSAELRDMISRYEFKKIIEEFVKHGEF